MRREFEAIIIGAGPAGLAAAVELAKGKVNVALIDDQARPGGQVHRRPPARFGSWSNGLLPTKRGIALLEEFKRCRAGIEIFQPAFVYAASQEGKLSLCRGEEVVDLTFERLILCEGAAERIIPFPGWTLPGVMTVGGLQRLLKEQRILAGRRILISGTGPLLYLAAAQLARVGARVVALAEAAPFREALKFAPVLMGQGPVMAQAVGAMAGLIRNRIAVKWSQGVISASGQDRVTGATLARLDAAGVPVPGTEKELAVDTIGLNHGFAPQNRLTRLLELEHVYKAEQRHWQVVKDLRLRSSCPGIYVAGDGGGIGGAESALLQGRLAGLHVLSDTKTGPGDLAAAINQTTRKLARLEPYSRAMSRCFGPRYGLLKTLDDSTIICRCEGVTAGQVRAALAEGVDSLAELKGFRPAMGPCQGRSCEANLTELMAANGFEPAEIKPLQIRSPLFPLPLQALKGAD